MRLYAEKLLELCEASSRIFIYGAGRNAKRFTEFLTGRGILVTGYIVSEREGNPEALFGLPVTILSEFQKEHKYGTGDLILVSLLRSSPAYKSVFAAIVDYQLDNVVFLPDQFLNFVKDEEQSKKKREWNKKLKDILSESVYYLAENVPVERGHFVLAMKGLDGEEYHWRWSEWMIEIKEDTRISDWFTEKTMLEEFQDQYGVYHVLHTLPEGAAEGKKTGSVYMAYTHADRLTEQKSFPGWIIPIQAGAALTDQRLGEVCDDKGENISERNGIYSECTALYWMWKHAPETDYIGLCHYRRHYDMSEEDWGRLAANDMDVLVTTPTFVHEGIGGFFSTWIPNIDLEMLLQGIEQVQPEYLPTARKFLERRFFPPCNMSIMKYDLFHRYAGFAFSVTFKIEEFYDAMRFSRRDRYMGYLMECLLGIFLMHHKEHLKIGYTDMIFYS